MKAYHIPDLNRIRIFDYSEHDLDELLDNIDEEHVHENKLLSYIEIPEHRIELLRIVFPEIELSTEAEIYVQSLIPEEVDLPTVAHWQSLLPIGTVVLRPFQIESLNWLEARRQISYPPNGTQTGAICSLDQGLGKTIVGIVWDLHLRELGLVRKTFIICLNNNKETTWKKHLEWLTNLSVVVIGGEKQKRLKQFKQFHTKDDIAVIHYEAVRLHPNDLNDIDHLMIDEAHKIANPDSKQSKTINSAAKKSKHITMLTGGAAQNRVELQLWHPLHICDRKYWGPFAKWKHDFCILEDIQVPLYVRGKRIFDPRTKAPVMRKLTIVSGLKNRAELSRRLAPYMYKKSKWEVGEQLPEKIYQVVHTGLTEKQRKLYIDVVSEVLTSINGVSIPIALTKTLRLLQIIATLEYFDLGDISKKADEASQMMYDIVPDGHKALVFSQHVKLAEAIYNRLKKLNAKPLLLLGENPKTPAAKNKLRDKFRKYDDKFLVTTIQLEGTGSDYPEADFVFRLDRDYRPEVNKQVEDRAHRLTSDPDKPVNIIDFVSKGTVEEGHMDDLQAKLSNMTDVYDLAKVYTMADITRWLKLKPTVSS